MENKFDTDEQLKNALRDFEAIPDSRSFDAILEKMNQEKKRRAFIIFFWAGLITLSGVALPLLFNFYGATQTPALSTHEIHKSSSAQHEVSTHSASASLTHSETLTTQASPSATVNTSINKITNPETDPNQPIPEKEQTHIVASKTQISIAQHKPEKNSFEKKNQQQVLSANKEPETHDKLISESNSTEKADHTQTSNLLTNVVAIETAPEFAGINDAIYLTPIQVSLPVDPFEPDMNASLKESAFPARFLVPEKKNTFCFYLGAQASPQLNGFAFSKNPNRDPLYNSSGINFSDFYLNAKKDQRHFNFSLPFGIKAGVQINDKYEVFAGFGYQSFIEQEKLRAVSSPTITSIDPGVAYNNAANFSVPYKNHFRYLSYSLEANRLFKINKVLGFKLGIGLAGNQLINSSYVFARSPNSYTQTLRGRENLSPWLLTTKVRAGLILNPGRRFQFHISPGFFYSPTSVFKKDYVIRQKPFGMDVECLMLFRLFHN